MPDYRLSADPAPKVEVTQGDGSNRPMRSGPKISSPITPASAPSLAVQLAEVKEENTLLRDQLQTVAASLRQLADSIGADLDQVELQARLAADDRRRFS